MRGEWEAMKVAVAPTAHVPLTEVQLDEATGYRIRTLGIERFATTR